MELDYCRKLFTSPISLLGFAGSAGLFVASKLLLSKAQVITALYMSCCKHISTRGPCTIYNVSSGALKAMCDNDIGPSADHFYAMVPIFALAGAAGTAFSIMYPLLSEMCTDMCKEAREQIRADDEVEHELEVLNIEPQVQVDEENPPAPKKMSRVG